MLTGEMLMDRWQTQVIPKLSTQVGNEACSVTGRVTEPVSQLRLWDTLTHDMGIQLHALRTAFTSWALRQAPAGCRGSHHPET